MARRVLLVDLGTETHGASGPVGERALKLAAQAEQAAPAGEADVDDAPRRIGQLIDAELPRQRLRGLGRQIDPGLLHADRHRQAPVRAWNVAVSSRCLSPGSSHPRAPEHADQWILGTSPGMTVEPG